MAHATQYNRSNDPWENVAYNREFQHNIFDILREGYNPDAIFNPAYFELKDEPAAADTIDVVVQPFSLCGFLLDETRPNFIGPRTLANQLAPCISVLQYTAFYWRNIGDAMWSIIENRAINDMIHIDYNSKQCQLFLLDPPQPNRQRNDYDVED